MTNKTCYVDGFYKKGIKSDECRTACLQEPSCTGFATSIESHSTPNLLKCYLHGNISLTEKYSDWNVWFNGK